MNLIWNLIFLCATTTFPFGQGDPKLFDELYCSHTFCKNGGSCTVKQDGFVSRPLYTGSLCENLIKNEKGNLPFCPAHLKTFCFPSSRDCAVDEDCPEDHTCCYVGCDSTKCHDRSCGKCQWSDWSECRPIPLTICESQGFQNRTRTPDCCQNPKERQHWRFCDLEPCPPCTMGPWESWTPCAATCGTYHFRMRTRTIIPEQSQENCKSQFTEDAEYCSLPECPTIHPCVDESRQCTHMFRPECSGSNAYEGRRNKTWSGRTCQYWDSQNPHKHRFSKLGHHNHCRNPNNFPAPWCYTTDPANPIDFCFPGCEFTGNSLDD